MRMKDKCGIVTAAGSGMGYAGAVRFAREGAAVAVVDIDVDAVQAVVGEIESAGGRAVGIPADLTGDEDSRRIVREAANALGGIDFVWNHVGHPGPASVEGIEMEDFDTAVALNLRTVLVTTDAAIPEIRARGGGALLYTASTSGLRASSFSPVYSAVKHGVVGFVKALGKRLAKLEDAAERARRKNPQGFASNANVKLLRAVDRAMAEVIPQDPSRAEYRQGNTLGRGYRHWRRARTGRRFRVFFRYDAKAKVIVHAWMNDTRALVRGRRGVETESAR